MRILRLSAMTFAMVAALATTGTATAGAAPFGSLGDGPDLSITHATGEGTNACSVLITNEGEVDATGVTVYATLYGSQDLGALAPGESTTATQFDCGIFQYIFYFVTANGESNWSNNYLVVNTRD